MDPSYPSPALPLELVLSIIDLLYDDKESLMVCSRLCSQLVTHCRHHLFEEVTIDDDTPGKTYRDFAMFISRTPHVAIHVRSLKIEGNDMSEAYPPSVLETAILTTILYSLPSLRSLSLVLLEVQAGFLSPAPLPSLTTVEELYLIEVVFETNLPAFFRWLTAFPNVFNLTIRELSWLESPLPQIPQSRTLPPIIHGLQILTMAGYHWDSCYPELLRWCRLLINPFFLRDLDTILLSWEHAQEIGGSLPWLGMFITSLRIRLSVSFAPDFDRVRECVNSLCLRECPKLTSFSLYFSPASTDEANRDIARYSWMFLVHCIQTLPPSVRSIELVMIGLPAEFDYLGRPVNAPRQVPWPLVDDELAKRRELTKVSIVMHTELVYSDTPMMLPQSVTSYLTSKLPKVQQRRILQFPYSESEDSEEY